MVDAIRGLSNLIITGSLFLTACVDKSLARSPEEILASGEWLRMAPFFHSKDGHLTLNMTVLNDYVYLAYDGTYIGDNGELGSALGCSIGDGEVVPASGRMTFPVDRYSINQLVQITCQWKNGHTETVFGSAPDPEIAFDLNNE